MKIVTLNLFTHDYELLDEIFPTMGKQVAVRAIVHKFVQDWKKDNQSNG